MAGFVISFLGGSRVQISGPTAAFATIVAGIVAADGIEGLAIATILAGSIPPSLLAVIVGIIMVSGLLMKVIIRMRSVNALDATAMHSLEQLCQKYISKKVQLVLSHVNEQPMHVMQKSGFADAIGNENFCSHIDDALKRAEDLQ